MKTSYDSGLVGGSFDGNFTAEIPGIPDEETGEITESQKLQNSATKDDFEKDEKGGVITLNFGLVKGFSFSTDAQADILGDLAVEEVIHAVQYDDLVSKDDVSSELPGTANTEFEAKTIVGQIQNESRKELTTTSVDKTANQFGVRAFQTGSTTGYFDTLRQWHSTPRNAYRSRRVTNVAPSLLERLIKK